MTCSSSLATRCYSIEPRTRKCVKRYGFLTFVIINLSNKHKNKLLDTGQDSLRAALKE